MRVTDVTELSSADFSSDESAKNNREFNEECPRQCDTSCKSISERDNPQYAANEISYSDAGRACASDESCSESDPSSVSDTTSSPGAQNYTTGSDIGNEDSSDAQIVNTPPAYAESFSETQNEEPSLENDVKTLLNEMPELRRALYGAINEKRFLELRRLGLSPREAYLATSAPIGADNRAHIISGVPSGVRAPELGMTSHEMATARELFEGLSEQEIKRLYATVTNQT